MKDLFSYDNLISIIITAVIVFVVWIFLHKLFTKLIKKAPTPQRIHIYTALEKVCKWILFAILIISIFSISPTIKNLIQSLIAGSGVLALVISFASQDAISNFVSGIIINFTKPYKVGDKIRYLDTDTIGYVEEIKIRHTVIRTFENTQLIVPNSVINSTAIENCTYNDDSRICVFLDLDITYESDAAKAMFLIGAVIKKHPGFIDCRTHAQKEQGIPPVRIRIIDFAESSVKIRAYLWAKDGLAGEDMKSEILLEIQKRFKASGIEFAYPHMQIVE